MVSTNKKTSRFQFDLKTMAILVAMLSAFAAILRYAIVLHGKGFTGTDVITGALGIVLLPICAGMLNRGSFLTMVTVFLIAFAIMMAMSF